LLLLSQFLQEWNIIGAVSVFTMLLHSCRVLGGRRLTWIWHLEQMIVACVFCRMMLLVRGKFLVSFVVLVTFELQLFKSQAVIILISLNLLLLNSLIDLFKKGICGFQRLIELASMGVINIHLQRILLDLLIIPVDRLLLLLGSGRRWFLQFNCNSFVRLSLIWLLDSQSWSNNCRLFLLLSRWSLKALCLIDNRFRLLNFILITIGIHVLKTISYIL